MDRLAAGAPLRETEVAVGFAEEGPRTRITFRKAVFSSPAARDAHNDGWSSAFELLTEYLADGDESQTLRGSP